MPSWPVSNTYVSMLQNGITTTLAWGTEKMSSSYIVKSMRAQRMIEEVKVEQGSGLTAIDVLVRDGDQVEITVVDDQLVIPPEPGDIVHVVNPMNQNGVLGHITARQGFYVIDNSYNAARKQEGEKVLLCKAFNAMTPLSTEAIS